MFSSVKLLLACAAALALLTAAVGADPDDHQSKEQAVPYDFSYAVKDDHSGNDFGHSEKSDGHAVTGEYYVLLPDGRRQIVSYTADHDSGYLADVKYEGEAKFDAPQQSQPSKYS